MTDIIARLRNLGWPLCHEGADEIARLRGYVETLKTSQSSAVVNELNDEIARLRAALQRIADDGKNCTDYCRRQARAALEPKP